MHSEKGTDSEVFTNIEVLEIATIVRREMNVMKEWIRFNRGLKGLKHH